MIGDEAITLGHITTFYPDYLYRALEDTLLKALLFFIVGGITMLSPAEVVFFWSGIMRDHAEFQLTTLSSREPEFIRNAQYYKDAFMSLRNEAKQLMDATDPGTGGIALVNKTVPVLLNFINFKRILVRKLLQCDIEIGLTPTFINHMINEAMEFYRDLCMLQSKTPVSPTAENILLHKIWLPDAAGHAAAIASDLDPTEYQLIQQAEEFKNMFEHLFIKAIELGQMLERACLDDGALQWLNEEAEHKIKSFICYLEKILELRQKCKAIGVIKPLMPDHMIREEKYYITKLRSLMRV